MDVSAHLSSCCITVRSNKLHNQIGFEVLSSYYGTAYFSLSSHFYFNSYH